MLSNEELAGSILELVPQIMRVIRSGMRGTASASFVLPHYRVLALLHRRPRGIGDLAYCQAVSLPTMSRTVSALVERRLIARSEDPTDRRRVLLHLTEEGCTLFLQLHGDIETVLARQIANLSAEERDRLAAGLDVLHRLFADHSPATAEDEEATRHSQRSGYVTNEEVQ